MNCDGMVVFDMGSPFGMRGIEWGCLLQLYKMIREMANKGTGIVVGNGWPVGSDREQASRPAASLRSSETGTGSILIHSKALKFFSRRQKGKARISPGLGS